MANVGDIAKETIDVLEYFDYDFMSKIPEGFMKKLKEISKNSNIKIKINVSKSLEEQNISEDCKNLISWIYYCYYADENEKKEIQKKWKINEEKYQEYISKKYDVNSIFNQSNNRINNTNNARNMDNVALVNSKKKMQVLMQMFCQWYLKNKTFLRGFLIFSKQNFD